VSKSSTSPTRASSLVLAATRFASRPNSRALCDRTNKLLQICQFCYNNVKNNMNGLCPACRRPYNEKDIEYKLITPEETAIHRARQVQKQKKNLQAQLKEKQRAEADSLSRKHLAGLRVVQKNLVYVTGLSPKLQEEELLHTCEATPTSVNTERSLRLS
jgi:transketolase